MIHMEDFAKETHTMILCISIPLRNIPYSA